MHCFEMRVGDMRAILAQAAGPPDTADSKNCCNTFNVIL
jgi:hypothetical protein